MKFNSRTKTLLAICILLGQLCLGRAALTWHWVSLPSDTNILANIASSMNAAVATYNTYSDYTGDVPVIYNSGVPTAQTDGMGGWIEFGGSISYRVAVHEMCHWLGTGTAGGWGSLNGGGVWNGTYGNSAVQSYDGPANTTGCDGLHFWPYNWNYDSEQANPERVVGMVGALRRDMGLDDMNIGYAPGTYRLRNRSNLKMLDNDNSIFEGTQAKQFGESGSINQQWILSLISGTRYFTLRSLGNGKLLDSLDNTNNGAAVGLMAENLTMSQQWQVVATDSGFYKLVNRATGKCLSAAGQSTDGTGLVGATQGSGFDQQWKFVHPTLVTIPVGLVSQYRSPTASSYANGLLPSTAADGNTTLTRWAASNGSYPQWWRVDLGSVYNITNVITYWYPGYTWLYRIETSTNDVNYATVVDATGNTVAGCTTNSLSATARYVRVTSTGVSPSGGWASFYDCQIFGTPAICLVPTGLIASAASSAQINLRWSDQGGVSSYNVKRGTTTGGPYSTIASGVKGVSYADSGVAAFTTYYYVVSAVNSAGESSNCAQAGATTSAATVPLAPAGLTALPGHNQVMLNWAVSAGAGGYNVMRATSSSGPYSPIISTAATTCTDVTAVNGTAYYYVVSATNAAGESANSALVAATPNVMNAHWKFDETSGTTAGDSAGSWSGTLQSGASWAAGKLGNAVALDGSSSGYVSYGSGVVNSLTGDFSVAAWIYVNTNGTSARVFDFRRTTSVYMYLTPVSSGNTTRYGITTSGSGGEQTLNGPALSPAAWHHVAVTLSGTTGRLYVDGNLVNTNGSMTIKPSGLGATTSNYIGKSHVSTDPYLFGRVDDFRVYSRALSAAEVAVLAAPYGLPLAPTSLAAVPGINQVVLSWPSVPTAVSYKVKRAIVSGGPYSTVGNPTTLSYSDTNVINGLTYYYVVSAVNAVGEGTDSTEVVATPSDLLAYWKFNEASGTNALDASGNGFTATLVAGTAWGAGRNGAAVSMNGSSNYVSLPQGVFRALNDFSVSTWVYVIGTNTSMRVFDLGVNTSTYMYLTPASSGNTTRYGITISGSGGEQVLNGPALSRNTWHHLVVALTGTTGILYIDGAAAVTNSSMTLKPSNLGITTQNYLGKSQSASDPYLYGRVDDLRIYSRVLNATEVTNLFAGKAAAPSAPAGLTANPASGQISLIWNASDNATSYKLKRSTTSGGPYQILTNLASTTFTDTNVVDGTTYYYVVTAVSISGESANTAEVNATPGALPPEITVPNTIIAEATNSAGAEVVFVVTANDPLDGPLTPSVTPASGSMFPLGTTTVTATATNTHGITATNTFAVVVVDTTPPGISLPTTIFAEATSPAGAMVSFSVSANDLVSGWVSAVANPASGSVFPLGTNVVSVTANDAAGNAATNSFLVIVDDTTPPVITVLGFNPCTNFQSVAFVDPGATAYDIVSGLLPVTTNGTVDVGTVGVYTVEYIACDTAGNYATNTRTVQVMAIPVPVGLNGTAISSGPNSGAFQLSFSGATGQPYRILGASDVSQPMTNWSVLASGTVTNNPVIFTDLRATSNAASFYRVVSP